MPDDWMRPHVGDEARPRPRFEDELANELHRAWHGGARRSRWWMAAAAVVAVVAGGVALLVNDRSTHDSIAPPTSLDVPSSTLPPPSTAAPATTEPVPDTADTVPDSTVEGDPEFEAVQTYLRALSAGDWSTAAGLLGEGGLEPEARADLRPLFDPEFGLVPGQVDRESLGRALQAWCARALCQDPWVLADRLDGWTKATYRFGTVELSSMFAGFVFEGQPGVRGLPLQWAAGGGFDPSVVVDCPDDGVDRVITWADLNGDGWLEQLVPQAIASTDDESGVRTYRVTVCGTDLVVEPFEITGDGLAIYPLNPTRSGPDTLLIGFLEGYPNGIMYRFDGTRIAALPDTRWDMGPPLVGYEQMSVGCADLLGDGSEEIVDYTYVEADGVVRYTAVPAIGGGASTEGQFASDSQEAGDLRIGMCHGLPVRTD